MKFVSINNIMDRITKHPLLQDITQDVAIGYIVDFMEIVGVPASFEDKTAVIHIENYRGELPCDFYEMVQVRLSPVRAKGIYNSTVAFRYTTDSFHLSDDKPVVSDLTYKLQGNVIFTSPLKEGDIEIAYKAIPVDENNMPMLPDDSVYLRAVEAYIKKQWFTIQFDMGKITQQAMQKADQDYAWAVGACQSTLRVPTIDQMQSLTAMWNTLIPRHSEHRKGFIHLGTQEHLRNH